MPCTKDDISTANTGCQSAYSMVTSKWKDSSNDPVAAVEQKANKLRNTGWIRLVV